MRRRKNINGWTVCYRRDASAAIQTMSITIHKIQRSVSWTLRASSAKAFEVSKKSFSHSLLALMICSRDGTRSFSRTFRQIGSSAGCSQKNSGQSAISANKTMNGCDYMATFGSKCVCVCV